MTDTGPALAGVEATAAEHGTKAANERALAALPMAGPPPVPGGRGGFLRPTERLNEPVTAGLSTGPGPGPSPMAEISRSDEVLARAKGLLQVSRDPRLAILIGRLEQGR